MKDKFELLLQRDIINILIGEPEASTVYVNFISSKSIIQYNSSNDYQMPYLSGPDIINISNKFGFAASFVQSKSRWSYMHDLIRYCINNDKIQQLLAYLFSKVQFKKQLIGFETPEQIRVTHLMIVDEIIKLINIQLAFGGHIFNKTENDIFYINEDGAKPSIETVVIKKIDMTYIKDLSDRATRDIENKEFDSALTKSRTLLEEVFCLVIEENGEEPSDKGEIGKLYSQVKRLYGMHQKKEVDERINTLLSGLEKILTSIGNMRNKASDSHGLGSKRFAIEEHHARLYVNSAMTFAEFILSVHIMKRESTY